MTLDYSAQLKHSILHDPGFIRALFSGASRQPAPAWKKVILRPVSIRRSRHIQFSYFDDARDITKNFRSDEAELRLDELLALSFKNIHVETKSEVLQVHFSAKGGAKLSRHKPSLQSAPNLSHDREKHRLISLEEAAPFLRLTGLMNQDGTLKAGKQDKFVQINEFLKLLTQSRVFDSFDPETPVHVVDFGCGNAYLTFALYYYMTTALGLTVRLTGVDLKDELIQRHVEKAAALGWDGLTFTRGQIGEYMPGVPPDVVVALHACDTATDNAIAQGIRWGSRLIVTAPCCQHHIQAQLDDTRAPQPFGAVWHDGILCERLGDVLTDTFRAQLLRGMGYKTDVVQFVSDAHTPKNLMIRAVKQRHSPDRKMLAEYDQLKTYWGVTPYLESRIDLPPTVTPT